MEPFELLPWDSDFLGYEVYRINRQLPGEEALAAMLAEMPATAQLIYYPSRYPVAVTTPSLQRFRGFEADIKTTYVKHALRQGAMPANIISYTADAPNEQLLQLAIQSGVWSRFSRDPRIGPDRFEALYTIWMRNSVNRTIARDVLIYETGGEIAGVVTVGEKRQRADIGLLAVAENHRGKGIGRTLMAAAEQWAIAQGHTSLQVVTQGLNKPACMLYEKSGCTVEEALYFYHFWPQA
ncbi:GNAT family N-acetyltransferase [Chitinophaga sp. Mgbs1]|uniref:GNAT family N-acetyltransferase n=1 Tax=Chitinophaga solisilvae TaxID=1233460 RepID=A0A433WFV5_9BACT|nr:GNAT family N-acetyltransferase [Chitinophaga solisilvae]